MLTEEGIVTRTDDTTAWIQTVRSKACESCEARDGCMTHDPQKKIVVTVPNTLHAKTGDRVVIGFESGPMLRLAFFLYVFPILGLLAGAAAGHYLSGLYHTDQTFGSLGAGALLFAGAVLIIRKSGDRLSLKNEYKPFLLRISQKNTAIL